MNGGRVSVRVYLTHETHDALRREATEAGLSLSAYLRAFAALLCVPADLDTPIAEIVERFRETPEYRRLDRRSTARNRL